METNFYNRIEGLNKLNTEAKIEKKKKQDQRLMDSLELRKEHGDPVTLNDIDRLDNLSDDQILAEASYWKEVNGGGNAIRFRHKVGDSFVKYTTNDFRMQVQNVVEDCIDSDYSRCYSN